MANTPEKKDLAAGSPSREEEEFGSPSPSKLEYGEGNDAIIVDKETEKRILRKLDIRIIPTVMWIYLMNMMDRGMRF